MKENLYNKANKATNDKYRVNYDQTFNNDQKPRPESPKVQRYPFNPYQGKRESN